MKPNENQQQQQAIGIIRYKNENNMSKILTGNNPVGSQPNLQMASTAFRKTGNQTTRSTVSMAVNANNSKEIGGVLHQSMTQIPADLQRPSHQASTSVALFERGQFFYDRISSDDSGFYDKPDLKDQLPLASSCSSLSNSDVFGSQQLTSLPPPTPVSRLEAHELSLSPPPTPVSTAPSGRKLLPNGTPNLIRRPLKTIAESLDQLRRPNASSAPKPGTSWARASQVSAEDNSDSIGSGSVERFDQGKSRRKGRKPRIRSKSLSRLDRRDSDDVSTTKEDLDILRTGVVPPSDGAPSIRGRRMKKSKSLSGKLWLKINGGRSAPSSPEASRKASNKEKVARLTDYKFLTSRGPINPVYLTDTERRILQDAAVDHLSKFNLGCSITVPKGTAGECCHLTLSALTHGCTFMSQSLKSFSSVRDLFQLVFNSGQSGRHDDSQAGPGRDQPSDESSTNESSGGSSKRSFSFGVPLAACVENDRLLGRGEAGEPETPSSGEGWVDEPGLYEGEGEGRTERSKDLMVPYVMRQCCQYITDHALNTTGIFRVGVAKSKTAELKAEFNSGRRVSLSGESNPHIVTSLLKEFLRELTDPLLTRDLYPAFIAVAGLSARSEQIEVLRLLVLLLPSVHCHALWFLLDFLHDVVIHSPDSIDSKTGLMISGNKMDAGNVALVFGPNILHRNNKNGKFQLETAEQVSQHSSVISVVKLLIEEYVTIFQVPQELYMDVAEDVMDLKQKSTSNLVTSPSTQLSDPRLKAVAESANLSEKMQGRNETVSDEKGSSRRNISTPISIPSKASQASSPVNDPSMISSSCTSLSSSQNSTSIKMPPSPALHHNVSSSSSLINVTSSSSLRTNQSINDLDGSVVYGLSSPLRDRRSNINKSPSHSYTSSHNGPSNSPISQVSSPSKIHSTSNVGSHIAQSYSHDINSHSHIAQVNSYNVSNSQPNNDFRSNENSRISLHNHDVNKGVNSPSHTPNKYKNDNYQSSPQRTRNLYNSSAQLANSSPSHIKDWSGSKPFNKIPCGNISASSSSLSSGEYLSIATSSTSEIGPRENRKLTDLVTHNKASNSPSQQRGNSDEKHTRYSSSNYDAPRNFDKHGWTSNQASQNLNKLTQNNEHVPQNSQKVTPQNQDVRLQRRHRTQNSGYPQNYKENGHQYEIPPFLYPLTQINGHLSAPKRDPSLTRSLSSKREISPGGLSRNSKLYHQESLNSVRERHQNHHRPQSAKERQLRHQTVTVPNLRDLGIGYVANGSSGNGHMTPLSNGRADIGHVTQLSNGTSRIGHVTQPTNGSAENWQKQKWRQWEEETRRRNAERAEQQTLV